MRRQAPTGRAPTPCLRVVRMRKRFALHVIGAGKSNRKARDMFAPTLTSSTTARTAVRQPASSACTVSVLPVVDLTKGTVSFAAGGQWQSWLVANPEHFARSLSSAVRSTVWIRDQVELVVTVAASGSYAGRAIRFSCSQPK